MKKESVPSKKTVRKTPAAVTRTRRTASPKVTAPAAPLETMPPTEADVARRAYEIFLGRNGADGDPVADWLQAEQELRSA